MHQVVASGYPTVSPISPRLVKRKNSPGRISACRAGRLNSPHRSSLPVVRVPVFVSLVVVPRGHAPVTHQDQGWPASSEEPIREPLALASPRKPSVPDRVQSTGRPPKTTANRSLACGPQDRANPLLAHDRGVPAKQGRYRMRRRRAPAEPSDFGARLPS